MAHEQEALIKKRGSRDGRKRGDRCPPHVDRGQGTHHSSLHLFNKKVLNLYLLPGIVLGSFDVLGKTLFSAGLPPSRTIL